MEWKAWAIGVGVGMTILAIIGLLMHADLRLVSADVLGAFAAISVVLLANRGRAANVAMSAVAAVALLAMALLAVTSHSKPWLTALTLAFAFAFGFVSWTAMSSTRRIDVTGRPRPV